MSEIWTPDTPMPSEQPGGGIELPKGVTLPPREEEKPAEQPAAPGRAGEGAPSRRGQPGEILFPPAGVQVQCPNCGTPFTAAVFSIVDLGANPELREPLLGGQINMAICPQCGAGGALSAPLMIHDPEHEFLAVFVPSQAQLTDVQVQKVIGEMSQALMSRLPSEKRRGYMLQPQQFFDWDSLMEKLWGFEGVTPEMLRRQRDQADLVSSLVRLGTDQEAMQLVIDRRKHLVDRDFFGLLGQVIAALRAQGGEENAQALMNLRQKLMETTEAGQEVKAMEDRLRQAIERLRPDMTRDAFLDLLLEYWKPGDEEAEGIVTALLSVARGLADYQFLMTLSNRIDQAEDPEERADLMALREVAVAFTQATAQSEQARAERAQQLLQEVLQAPDPAVVLREHADEIDQMFLAVLAGNIQQVEKNGATYAAKRLRAIYEQALSILEENLPPEMRLLNQLVAAPDEKSVRRILQENRSLLSKEFVESLQDLENRFREEGQADLANRLKSVRSQATLML
ncbi:MAG: hypothetical protein D6790_06220 [Caldilineae bacterium]|nr:MAG: hypothetical protein D6790_06220 [Caldilineae bacterium]